MPAYVYLRYVMVFGLNLVNINQTNLVFGLNLVNINQTNLLLIFTNAWLKFSVATSQKQDNLLSKYNFGKSTCSSFDCF